MSRRSLSYISLGSNLGNRLKKINQMVFLLGDLPDSSISKVSSLYETSPIGGPKQRSFYNAVVSIETKLSPALLLTKLQKIEKQLGRKRIVRWGPRVADLDILLMGKITRKKTPLIPHPRYHERRFVLVPLCEMAPNEIHPLFKIKNYQLLSQLTDLSQRVTMAAQWKNNQYVLLKKKKETKSP
ncbi:MAG: 2-amino-4-hydroxy-6-hydroxymethyldihydropteridine diphosphokinase [Elusimicrobiota bacterium]